MCASPKTIQHHQKRLLSVSWPLWRRTVNVTPTHSQHHYHLFDIFRVFKWSVILSVFIKICINQYHRLKSWKIKAKDLRNWCWVPEVHLNAFITNSKRGKKFKSAKRTLVKFDRQNDQKTNLKDDQLVLCLMSLMNVWQKFFVWQSASVSQFWEKRA